jgi:alpha-mannosidase
MTDPVTPSAEIDPINDAIERLRALTQVTVQNYWRCCPQDLPVAVATQSEGWNDWSTAQLNPKGYIVWSAGRQVMWLGQRFVVPHDLQGYPLTGLALRLVLTWWAEYAQIFVNGQLVQEGDLFDSSARVLLSSAVVPGEEITVALRLVSPGHDIGALMRSHCVYEAATGDHIDPGFVADELAVLHKYIEAFEPEKLDALAAAVAEIDWEAVSQKEEFTRSLSRLRQNLQSKIHPPLPPLSRGGQEGKSKILLLGHAHLDLAWLWTVSETWEVAQRTFESVLTLQQEFPELTFCHSTPALYAWIEQHRPDLFTAIKQQIAAGRWEVVGGMWVEPELNLISGESIVRQVLYAQRYVQEKFGQLTLVAWVPDSFGFCWQLPQILKQGGLEYFVTQKLHWNDTSQFPYGAFWWRSPDGTQIFSLMSPPNTTGVMDTNPLTMAAYAINWETQTNLKDAFWLPGVGDHGGGPTRDMLQVAKRWQQSPFFPRLEFTTALSYLQQLERGLGARDWGLGIGNSSEFVPHKGGSASLTVLSFELGRETQHSSSQSPIPNPQSRSDVRRSLSRAADAHGGSPITNPVWNDELYLEFHRGCYTTHADQKLWNRRCEGLLYQAELFASLATLTTGASYPKIQLEDAWKKVLFNQFHDILPGTSIPEVFVEANQAWQEVEQVGLEILEESLKAIASQITLPPPPQPDAQPLMVFNPLNWERSEIITISIETLHVETLHATSLQMLSVDRLSDRNSIEPTLRGNWEIYDLSGEKIPSQLTEKSTLLFLAKDIPSVGYRVFWLCPCHDELGRGAMRYAPTLQENWILENELLRVVVDPDTGDLSSIFDKIHQREVLSGSGNQLQAFQDSGQYWDAWNIDPNYAQHPLPPTQLKSIEWLERGVLRSRLRVVRQLGQSRFCQDYVLCAESPLLKIVTTVDWQERHVLVKAAFPLNLEADFATYEIPCGAIQRPTRPQTAAEQAKWEVPALRWADLGDEEYGVSLLNDCKYGYDSQPSQLRLTLLRSPSWPDPEADRGIHQFTYAIYPHSGSWQSAGTVRRGYELNLPMQVMLLSTLCDRTNSSLPAVGQFLDLQADNLILMALKQAEDCSDQWILRCYECHGEVAESQVQSDLGLNIAHSVDLLERPTQILEASSDGKAVKILPWEIASFTLLIS